MLVKYIEKGTNSCCLNTITHAQIEKNEETGKYCLTLQLADSIVSIMVKGNDNITYSKLMDYINELYDSGKIDFTSNIDITTEKILNVTPELLATMGGLGDIGDLDELDELDDLDDIDDEDIDFGSFLN